MSEHKLPKVVEDVLKNSQGTSFSTVVYGEWYYDANTIKAAILAYDREVVEPLVEALKPFLEYVPHYVCDEDCWYSCPKSGKGCNHSRHECNCGAEKANADRAILHAALARYQAMKEVKE